MNFRHNFQRFCEDTSIHGFLELFRAKSFVWKSLWLLVLGTAAGLSVYQILQTTTSATEQPTATLVEKFVGDQQYPPLHICYPYWVNVVDWDKAEGFGFDKDTVIYGMSSLDVIHVNTYNFTRARFNFGSTMNRNGFTNFWQFFSAVAFAIPPGFRSDISGWNITVPPETTRLCYVANSDAIKQALLSVKNPSNQKTISLKFNPKYFTLNTSRFSLEEYANNIVAIISSQIENSFVDQVAFMDDDDAPNPLLSFTDVYTDAYVLADEAMGVAVVVTTNLYTWLNFKSNSCKNQKVQPIYENCNLLCWWKEYMIQYPDGCMDVNVMGLFEDTPVFNICLHGVHTPREIFGKETKQDNFNPNNSSNYKACIAEYCTPPCQQWVYRSTINPTIIPSTVAKHLHLSTQFVKIRYPNSDTVFSVREIQTQTWQTLVASIGGILGLWLGASVISVLQMVYLLCCSSIDENASKCNCSCCSKTKKPTVKMTTGKPVVSKGS